MYPLAEWGREKSSEEGDERATRSHRAGMAEGGLSHHLALLRLEKVDSGQQGSYPTTSNARFSAAYWRHGKRRDEKSFGVRRTWPREGARKQRVSPSSA